MGAEQFRHGAAVWVRKFAVGSTWYVEPYLDGAEGPAQEAVSVTPP